MAGGSLGATVQYCNPAVGQPVVPFPLFTGPDGLLTPRLQVLAVAQSLAKLKTETGCVAAEGQEKASCAFIHLFWSVAGLFPVANGLSCEAARCLSKVLMVQVGYGW